MAFPYRKSIKPPLGTSLNKGHRLAKGLVGLWLMNEKGGGNILDSSGHVNTGAITGATWAGNGLSFDGDDDVDIGTNIYDLGIRRNATFTAWFNPSNVTSYLGIVGDWNLSNGMSIRVNSNATLEFFVYPANDRIANAGTVIANKWQHIAGVMDGGNMYLYLDGEEIGNAVITEDVGDPITNFRIGARGDDTYRFSGLIKDVSIYNRALSANEISELYREPYAMFKKDDVFGGVDLLVGTNMKINIGDSFKDIDSIKINIGDVWKSVVSVKINVGDSWKSVF